jgi:hypothetical protein
MLSGVSEVFGSALKIKSSILFKNKVIPSTSPLHWRGLKLLGPKQLGSEFQ